MSPDTPDTRIQASALDKHPEAIETERKFLALQPDADALKDFEGKLAGREGIKISHIQQGYVSRDVVKKVRLRLIRDENDHVTGGFITLKGPQQQEGNDPKERLELEIPVPKKQLELYHDLFDELCPDSLRKTRYAYKDPSSGRKFDIDRYNWSEATQKAFDNAPWLADNYRHLVTVDVELPQGDKTPLSDIVYFPKFLRPFLSKDEGGKPVEITRDCKYKSAALAALNTHPTDEYIQQLMDLGKDVAGSDRFDKAMREYTERVIATPSPDLYTGI